MKKMIMLLACMMLLAGCTESNIVNPKEETVPVSAPDMELRDDIEIEWLQVSEDTEWLFNDQEHFPYTRDYSFYLEPQKKEIMLMWVVADDIPDSEVRSYADALIKNFNDMVAIQDFSIERSSEDSYGGLWDEYGLAFAIAPESTQDDEDTWLLSGAYDAGVEFVLPDPEVIENADYEIDMPEAQGPGADVTEASNEGPESEES